MEETATKKFFNTYPLCYYYKLLFKKKVLNERFIEVVFNVSTLNFP